MEALLPPPEPTPSDLPVSQDLLRLLSAGLLELLRQGEAHPLRAPYPAACQRALNQLAAECLERGMCPPGT